MSEFFYEKYSPIHLFFERRDNDSDYALGKIAFFQNAYFQHIIFIEAS